MYLTEVEDVELDKISADNHVSRSNQAGVFYRMGLELFKTQINTQATIPRQR